MGEELKTVVDAFGAPIGIALLIGIYILRNGGLKNIFFKDGIEDSLGKLTEKIDTLSKDTQELKTDVAVLKALQKKEKE